MNEWEEPTMEVQFECIRRGGRWVSGGKQCGNGLLWHYKAAQTLAWPNDDHHRWSDLILDGILSNDVTVLAGASDTGKTYTASKWALIDYWVYPEDTLTILSSTEGKGLELRIWGAIKDLFNAARERYKWLSGNVLESYKAITTESIDQDNQRARSLKRGLICVPCMSNGKYVGLGKFVGIKSRRLRHIGDEVSVMQPSFLDAYANWYKPGFKGILCGNPLEVTDPLGIAAEPQEGWTGMPVPEKTKTWRSRWYNAWVINLVGTDSPNFDYPRELGIRYPYLISWVKIDKVRKDSLLYASQVEGVMRPGLHGKRIFTQEFARQHHAMDQAVWDTPNHTKVYAIDPAYGGGDRCIGMAGAFGDNEHGEQILAFEEPEEIPIKLGPRYPLPEDQIVIWVQSRLKELGIPSRNCFYDSFGKGTVGGAFSRIFGFDCPIPVNSGDKPTPRPVRYDLFVDDKKGGKRLKRCDEQYSKFVSEMWFSLREACESDQLRQLPQSVLDELCKRSYEIVGGNKLEAEPKDEMKQRTGYSPDLADCAAILCEGARRLGFKISRLGNQNVETEQDLHEMEIQEEEFENMIQSKLLQHA